MKPFAGTRRKDAPHLNATLHIDQGRAFLQDPSCRPFLLVNGIDFAPEIGRLALAIKALTNVVPLVKFFDARSCCTPPPGQTAGPLTVSPGMEKAKSMFLSCKCNYCSPNRGLACNTCPEIRGPFHDTAYNKGNRLTAHSRPLAAPRPREHNQILHYKATHSFYAMKIQTPT
ncbi:hypothetical protein CCM_03312 [Cordyceps militaris CM01]|uniref:Uncharacterized protein n=1 Tax=Cordyceps militaris (strain CM01) TaxID=983644 RepID=G3JA20_CORMM|nr:uncharacterized protein CCM_03312 [Cordyceps militaris CM01]EGX95040.1 hypothetical protein CCM_03312 [Cordyceps militaris CM01]